MVHATCTWGPARRTTRTAHCYPGNRFRGFYFLIQVHCSVPLPPPTESRIVLRPPVTHAHDSWFWVNYWSHTMQVPGVMTIPASQPKPYRSPGHSVSFLKSLRRDLVYLSPAQSLVGDGLFGARPLTDAGPFPFNHPGQSRSLLDISITSVPIYFCTSPDRSGNPKIPVLVTYRITGPYKLR